jgi:hypothetical protein
MNLLDLDDRVTAAAVAATGTVIGALIQLRAAWRNEVSARARGVPVTKKSRRGPVAAVLLLLIAAGVGGFALSQYLGLPSERESAALRGELQTQLAQINATAQRLERATQSDRGSVGHAEDRPAAQDVTVTTTVGPCHARAVAATDTGSACSEPDAVRATLCASVPSASATAVDLYARPENSAQPWTESAVAAGQSVGPARFADAPFERAESEQTKLVCAAFLTWDATQAYSARIVVKYARQPALHEVSRPVALPTEAPSPSGPTEPTGPATGAEPGPASGHPAATASR